MKRERSMRQKDGESDKCDEKSLWRANHAGRRGGALTYCDMAQPGEVGGRFATQKKEEGQ